jgi:hypothetical protein
VADLGSGHVVHCDIQCWWNLHGNHSVSVGSYYNRLRYLGARASGGPKWLHKLLLSGDVLLTNLDQLLMTSATDSVSTTTFVSQFVISKLTL